MPEQFVAPIVAPEPAAAFLQAAITLALAVLFVVLHRRYHKRYFAAWAVAWLLYALRLGSILVFLVTERPAWLYWHQVVTGWTSLALLWAALVFSQRIRWRNAYLIVVAFPVLWSYVAIYRLDDFLLAAVPAVVFLSAVTLWTAWVFSRHYRNAGSSAAAFLAGTLLLWGLHHLDYPFLRAQGVWNPWGYYLDILFELAVGTGILLLVIEDLDRGLGTLSVLSGQLRAGARGQFRREWLERALTLQAVRGSALWVRRDDSPELDRDPGGTIIAAAGTCVAWLREMDARARETIERAVRERGPVIVHGGPGSERVGYIAALPLLRRGEPREVLVVTGDARDPFAALDTDYLVTLGQQLGAVLDHAELNERLETRTRELERLASRMARQHEDERARLSRELHDETAQVFAAIHMQLAVLRERADPADGEALDRVLALIAQGIRGIRGVTDRLRPPLLDDLGMLPALRGLVDTFVDQHGLPVRFEVGPHLPRITETAEVALYRALQEALSNIALHAGAQAVNVNIEADEGVRLTVRDDGRGLAGDAGARGSGLTGMQERLALIGGTMSIRNRNGGGVELIVTVPEAGA
ncbi:MAG: GAF domain-containing sensor histidine kinase [Gemmatimonadetes bacterium]|nr:GAF domain-containing sensor histidine kinase [Gemmatimonadota bacterium]